MQDLKKIQESISFAGSMLEEMNAHGVDAQEARDLIKQIKDSSDNICGELSDLKMVIYKYIERIDNK